MPEDFAILLVLFAISMTANVGLGIAWFRASRRVNRLEVGKQAPSHLAMSDERLDRVEALIESLASQVDQLQSSQEFVNRLITNKPGRLWNPEGERAREITPH